MKQLLVYLKKLHDYAGAKLYINFFSMMLLGFIDGFMILLLIPMLTVIGVLNDTQLPLVSSIIEPLKRIIPFQLSLPVMLGLFVAIMVGQSIIYRYQVRKNVEIQQGYMSSLRLEIYRGLLQANWPFFIQKRKSDFNHIMSHELTRVGQGTLLTLSFATTFFFTAVQVLIALWLSWQLTAVILCCGLAIAIFSRKFVRRAKKLGDQTSEIGRVYMGGITDHFNGIKDIKSNRLEVNHYDWFHSVVRSMERTYVNMTYVQSNSQLVYRITSALFIAGIVYGALVFLQVRVEQLMLIFIIFSRLWPRFMGLQSNWEQIAITVPAFQSLYRLKQEFEASQELRVDDRQIPRKVGIRHALECQNVFYSYGADSTRYALTDVSVTIPANSMTAIVGKSGAGKSTLVDMLIGLVKPEKGDVLVDGESVFGPIADHYRSSIGYVSQDPFLFHASLRENLMMVASDASEEQLWEALEFASAADFVRHLPEGLDTVIGDRGIRLSGGERQRVVLARAILRKPSILVLDEATSALDSENEAKIQRAIERLKGRMTIIVIAHRLSTIRNADQVIVLEDGKVIQQGDYTELSIEKKGMFSKLLDIQAK